MRKRICRTLVWTTGLVVAVLHPALAETSRNLGTFPLCEPSAAQIVPCPSAAATCLLVGDNEQKDRLFLMTVVDGLPGEQRELPFGRDRNGRRIELSDIEALTRVGANAYIALGSHSRNTKCETKKKRRRLLRFRLTEQGIISSALEESRKVRCDRLFTRTASQLGRAICDLIDATEKAAQKIEKQFNAKEITEGKARAACNAIAPFNVEGLIAVSGLDGAELWVGLRAPLLPAHPDNPLAANLAILLRMKDEAKFQFDEAALIDLGGRGIRELAIDRGYVWGIAGPAEDRKVPFELWRFPVRELAPGALIRPEYVRTLPPSSEGLALADGQLYVLIDGSRPKSDSERSCDTPAEFRVF